MQAALLDMLSILFSLLMILEAHAYYGILTGGSSWSDQGHHLVSKSDARGNSVLIDAEWYQ